MTVRKVLFGCGLVVLGLAANPYLRGDGVAYYAYVRSAVIDNDLRFENEYRRGDPAFKRNFFDENGEIRRHHQGRDGYTRNAASVGPALVWAPAFLAAHAFVVTTNALGLSSWAADGYSAPYLRAVGATTVWMSIGGLYLCQLRIRPRRQVSGVAIFILLATSLPVYVFLLPFWSLALTILPAAVLLNLWQDDVNFDAQRWALMGLMCGLAASLHPVAIAWAVLAPISLVMDAGTVRHKFRASVAFGVAALAVSTPQFLVKAVIHGSPFDSGYPSRWDFLARGLLRDLFSNDHGLFLLTPAALICVVGVVRLATRPETRRTGVALIAVFITISYMTAAYVVPEQSSFGNRFFIMFTPGFFYGAAVIVPTLFTTTLRRCVFVGAATALVCWNLLYAFQWAWGMVPKRGPIAMDRFIRAQLTDAPREAVRVAGLLITDRSALVREAERRDEENLKRGEG